MGQSYSVRATPSVEPSFQLTEEVTPIENESQDSSHAKEESSEEYIYVLVHNGNIKYYVHDETLLDSKIQYYMRQLFQEYITRWDAFNYNVVTQEGICCPESGLVKRIRLMSCARYLLGLHEQVEEEILIYKVPSLPSRDYEEDVEEEEEKVEEESEVMESS